MRHIVIWLLRYIMKGKMTKFCSYFVLLTLSVSLISIDKVWAKAATIEIQKSILVSKLAKYISWPEEAKQHEFIIGVFEDADKYQYFTDFFADKGVKGKDISVRLVESYGDAKNVNILYMPLPNRAKSQRIATRLIDNTNVLIVSENINKLAKTMVDISYQDEDSSIDVKVVDPNIVNKELVIPELSSFVNNSDNQNILSISPSAALKNQQAQEAAIKSERQQQFFALERKLKQQDATVKRLQRDLNNSQKNARTLKKNLKQENQSLQAVQQVNAEKDQTIKSKDETIKQLEQELITQQELMSQEPATDNQTDTKSSNELMTNAEDAAKIAQLTEEVAKQSAAAENATAQLAETKAQLAKATPSSYQSLFYLALLLAIVGFIAAFLMWKRSQKAVSPTPIVKDDSGVLKIREEQLVKSENVAALGYVATDITYAVGISLDELHEQFEASGHSESATALQPIMTLLENFNVVAADQDETDTTNFDLVGYLKKMLILYDFEFSQSNIAYNYSGENKLTVNSIPAYVAMILINIVNNSLKHGFDNNGNGKVALSVEKGTDSGAIITFSDNGKGMTPNEVAQVFKPFFTTQSKRGYVGIGMSNTYDLVTNKLGGHIDIESEERKGTTVTITLP